MSQNKPKLILTRKLPETIETRMRELFDATLNDSDQALTRDELEAAVKWQMSWYQLSLIKLMRI